MKGKKSPSTSRRLRNLVDAFGGAKILVVGDIMVDRYYWGQVSRISPEAPVPVVQVNEETRRLGGAANVAHNITSLGGEALLCGVAGKDQDGEWLLGELDRLGIDGSGIVLSDELPTIVKSRVVAHNQQVVRFDRERRGDLPSRAASAVRSCLREVWGKVAGAVVSDYGKGVIDERLMDRLRILNRGKGRIPVAVDPKSVHFERYRRTAVITPNLREAFAAASLAGEKGRDVERVGASLLRRTKADAILVTRGEEGMSLFESGKSPLHIPTVAREVFDVTGAGDTVIGALTLCLAAGGSLRDAAYLANLAAGVVVGEFGTVPATKRQLLGGIPRRLAF